MSDVRCDRDDVDVDGCRGGDQQAIGAGRQLHRGIAVGGDRGQHGDVGRGVRRYTVARMGRDYRWSLCQGRFR